MRKDQSDALTVHNDRNKELPVHRDKNNELHEHKDNNKGPLAHRDRNSALRVHKGPVNARKIAGLTHVRRGIAQNVVREVATTAATTIVDFRVDSLRLHHTGPLGAHRVGPGTFQSDDD